MRTKVGFVAVAVVLALLGFAVAGAVAHGAASRHTDATTVTEPTSSSTTTTSTSTTTTSPTTPGPELLALSGAFRSSERSATASTPVSGQRLCRTSPKTRQRRTSTRLRPNLAATARLGSSPGRTRRTMYVSSTLCVGARIRCASRRCDHALRLRRSSASMVRSVGQCRADPLIRDFRGGRRADFGR
jgi:hypothetical protein